MGDDRFAKDRLGPYGDDTYEILLKAHEGLSEAESHALNIRLILIMANYIGDVAALSELIQLARDDQG